MIIKKITIEFDHDPNDTEAIKALMQGLNKRNTKLEITNCPEGIIHQSRQPFDIDSDFVWNGIGKEIYNFGILLRVTDDSKVDFS
jgi:hypothetical protein